MDTRRLEKLVIRLWIRSFFIVALASITLASATSSFAENGTRFRFGLEGNNLIFTTPQQAIEGGSFRLAVKNGQRARVSLELVDLVSNAAGLKTSIPLNSSPFTPNGLVQFTESYPIYEPSGEFQYFDISMSFKGDVPLDRPVLGGIAITLIPETQSREPVGVNSSIVATFSYLPSTGMNLEAYSPGLTLSGPTIVTRTPDFFPLNLLPEIPFFLNHGDLALSYQLRNSGKIFLETLTSQSVQHVGMFGQPDETVFTGSKEKFLIPNQSVEEKIIFSPPASDSKPLGIGVYRFSLNSDGHLGDQIDTSTSNEQIMIIFPWKQSLLVLGLLLVFRRRLARVFKWILDYGKAFREFRGGKGATPDLQPRLNQAPPALQRTLAPKLKPKTKSKVSPVASTSTARSLYPSWYDPETYRSDLSEKNSQS